MTYYVYSIHTKRIVNKNSSRNVAIHVLNTYNKKRGELGFAMMDKETYMRNYEQESKT